MKKKILTIIVALGSILCTEARTTLEYQTLVCDSEGKPMAQTMLSFNIAVHQDSADGTIVLTESHTTTTSEAGVAYLRIGEQEQNTQLDDLDWAGSTYFLEMSVDRGSGMESMGCSQIMSVPRAIYAVSAQEVILTSPSGKKFKVTINNNGEVATVPVSE